MVNHCFFYMLDSPLTNSEPNGVKRIPCLLLVVVSSILGVIGIGMLFIKDYRTIEINE